MEKTAFAPIAALRERLMLIVKALMPLAPMALAVLWQKRVIKDSQFVLCHPYGAEIVLYGFLALTLLSMTAIAVMIHGRFASSILRHRQFPPHPLPPCWQTAALGRLMAVLISCVFICSFSLWRLAGARMDGPPESRCHANGAGKGMSKARLKLCAH